MRFLIAEDEYYARKALVLSVQTWQKDAVISEAENGMTALSLMRAQPFDVLLLDIRMPQMDGLTLAAQVNAEYPDAYKIMITGYGEFEYAQAALKSNVRDYLLKPVDDDKLCEALERAREWHGQRQRERLERENLRSDGEQMRRMLAYHQVRTWLTQPLGAARPAYVTALAPTAQRCLVFFAYERNGRTREMENALQALLLEGEEKQEGVRYVRLPAQGGTVCVLALYGPGLSPTREARLSQLRTWQQAMGGQGLRVRMAMSGLSDVARAPYAFRQAQNALDYRLLRPDLLLSYGALKEQTRYVSALAVSEEAELSSCLEQGRAQEAEVIALGAVEQVAAQPDASLVSLQDVLGRICGRMNRAIEQTVADVPDEELFQVSLATENFSTMEQLKEAVSAAIRQVCALKERVAVSGADEAVEYIRQHIFEHYSENISLKELAETRLYLNASYLSRLFKARTGVSFRTFLTGVRMQKACDMLKTRDMSVMSIAAECGYADASQFIQLFRKHYGVTPSVWREKNAGFGTEL